MSRNNSILEDALLLLLVYSRRIMIFIVYFFQMTFSISNQISIISIKKKQTCSKFSLINTK